MRNRETERHTETESGRRQREGDRHTNRERAGCLSYRGSFRLPYLHGAVRSTASLPLPQYHANVPSVRPARLRVSPLRPTPAPYSGVLRRTLAAYSGARQRRPHHRPLFRAPCSPILPHRQRRRHPVSLVACTARRHTWPSKGNGLSDEGHPSPCILHGAYCSKGRDSKLPGQARGTKESSHQDHCDPHILHSAYYRKGRDTRSIAGRK